MGRGDKRSRKGKIFKGSFGNSRPHKVKKAEGAVVTATKPVAAEKKTAKRAPAKKAAAKKADAAE